MIVTMFKSFSDDFDPTSNPHELAEQLVATHYPDAISFVSETVLRVQVILPEDSLTPRTPHRTHVTVPRTADQAARVSQGEATLIGPQKGTHAIAIEPS